MFGLGLSSDMTLWVASVLEAESSFFVRFVSFRVTEPSFVCRDEGFLLFARVAKYLLRMQFSV